MVALSFLASVCLFTLSLAQMSTFAGPAYASACAAQTVLDACLASTQDIANACPATDYTCLCSKWGDVAVCLNLCPNDARHGDITSKHSLFCTNAAAYTTTTAPAAVAGPTIPTTASVAVATITTAAATITATTSAAAPGFMQGVPSSATANAAEATGKSDARQLAMNSAGLLLGVAGLAVAFL